MFLFVLFWFVFFGVLDFCLLGPLWSRTVSLISTHTYNKQTKGNGSPAFAFYLFMEGKATRSLGVMP